MQVIKVKNMVCDRCKMVLQNALKEHGFSIATIDLGEITFNSDVSSQLEALRQLLEENGFELIEEAHEKLITTIKSELIKLLESDHRNQTISDHLSQNIGKDYSVLSKLFSAKEEITIEKYFIRLKIEKVKELIQMQNASFSEIAYQLDYTSSSHLARQFKSITGMSMTAYQKSQDWNRKPLDQIM